jgi:hypothetical protein
MPEVSGRSLNDRCRGEAGRPHSLYRVCGEVTNQAEIVLAFRTHVDVPSACPMTGVTAKLRNGLDWTKPCN